MTFRSLTAQNLLAFGVGLLLCFSKTPAQQAPAGFGQLEQAPRQIPGGIDENGREYEYLGQPATGKKLVLTASNGFFTKGTAQAKGESKLPKVGDEDLIVPNYEHLAWKSTNGSLRWHILISKPGRVQFDVFLDSKNAGSDVEVSFAGQTQTVKTTASNSKNPQPWNLVFDVTKPGEHELNLRATKIAGGSGIGNLHRIDAFGPAVDGAHLLRVRWRPAAAHGGYDTAKVRNAKLLVFTTRSVSKISNYSPITTPFGYYGTTFDNDGRSGGGFNFSMWGSKASASDLKLMPHLLAVGSPDGEFSGFGHEGSGVKPRGWDPMPDKPELVVQALRLVPGEKYDTYFGYYFDHPTQAWKLFGAGNKWHGGKPTQHLKLGSFCEVPGPPQVERTGDIYREVRRRGWAYDDGKWVFLETYNAGGKGSKKGDDPVNKSWYTTSDGEYAMGCGGIRLYKHKPSQVTPGGSGELPYFLKSPTIKTVFSLPIEYRNIQVAGVSANSATIEFEIGDHSGGLKESAIYFGTADALTFAPRKLHGTEKKSELSKSVNDRTWQQVAKITAPKKGRNQIKLEGLKSGTTYHFRILSSNAVSRIWSNETGSFKTK